MKKIIVLLIVLVCFKGLAQSSSNLQKIEDAILYKKLDSLKFQFHEEASLIDSLWINELINSPLNDTLRYSIEDDEVFESEWNELPTKLLKERLLDLDSKTPFHIEYNPQLEQIIKTYLKRRKSSLASASNSSKVLHTLSNISAVKVLLCSRSMAALSCSGKNSFSFT